MSLPLAFKTELSTIPAKSRYLAADADKLAHWASVLGPKTQPRIGLVWSGSATHQDDHNRSLKLQALLDALPKGYQLVSLQKEVRDWDLPALKDTSRIQHFGEKLTSFSDTAALCELMDLVISVDTSVAHLSAALGQPTWVLLPFVPDWRWMLNRQDSPWYPTMRLYRQAAQRDWSQVLVDVARDLGDRLSLVG
jgi:ADP-heptose:LPS heptosyltransferase